MHRWNSGNGKRSMTIMLHWGGASTFGIFLVFQVAVSSSSVKRIAVLIRSKDSVLLDVWFETQCLGTCDWHQELGVPVWHHRESNFWIWGSTACDSSSLATQKLWRPENSTISECQREIAIVVAWSVAFSQSACKASVLVSGAAQGSPHLSRQHLWGY